jgi:hypothetical protein
MAGWSGASGSRRDIPLLALGDGIERFCRRLLLGLVWHACNLRLAADLYAAPNAVFSRELIRNSVHHDIRRIPAPLHAELRQAKAARRGCVSGKPATAAQIRVVALRFCGHRHLLSQAEKAEDVFA